MEDYPAGDAGLSLAWHGYTTMLATSFWAFRRKGLWQLTTTGCALFCLESVDPPAICASFSIGRSGRWFLWLSGLCRVPLSDSEHQAKEDCGHDQQAEALQELQYQCQRLYG